jgi:hypothetical protein
MTLTKTAIICLKKKDKVLMSTADTATEFVEKILDSAKAL